MPPFGESVGNVLVVALGGWNDAGQAASMAGDVLVETAELTLLEELEPDDYFDYHLVRPSFVRGDGDLREIEWPRLELFGPRSDGAGGAPASDPHAPPASASRRLYVVRGEEPSRGWRSFARVFQGWLKEHEIGAVVLMGAMLAETPHTRDVPVRMISESARVRRDLGIEPNGYTGIVGVLSVLAIAAEASGAASVSLWGYLPYYTDGSRSSKCALALLQQFSALTDGAPDTRRLRAEALAWEAEVSTMVDTDDELRERVAALEQQFDEGLSPYSINTDYWDRELQTHLRRGLPDDGDAPH